VGSIPTLLVAQSLDHLRGAAMEEAGCSKEQREGDGLRNYLGVTLNLSGNY